MDDRGGEHRTVKRGGPGSTSDKADDVKIDGAHLFGRQSVEGSVAAIPALAGLRLLDFLSAR